jgi:hypothetical protein
MVMKLDALGIRTDLPRGWEGSIDRVRRGAAGGLPPARGRGPAPPTTAPDGPGPEPTTQAAPGDDEDEGTDLALAHLANFPLPADRGDFGSGAVEHMLRDDVFVALLEYEPASATTPLFEQRGLPRNLLARDFGPSSLQRTLAGQSGTQVFFQQAGRAFCLYVVLGEAARAIHLVPAVNRALATITIGER